MSLKVTAIGLLMSLAMAAVALAQDSFPSVKVAEIAGPSVVSIDANSIKYGSLTAFGGALESSRSGSLAVKHLTGFIYQQDSKNKNLYYIITDSEDVEEAALIAVHFNDGSELPGRVIGVDTFYGIAVLQVDSPKPLKPVKVLRTKYDPLSDKYPYNQGDSVVAIGYSGGYGGTVTYGIISAIRNFRNRSLVLLPSVIQADVVINTGNEGGPLFNEKGEVLAVHERRGGGGSMQNTTFFTPIWLIARAADDIIADYLAGEDIEVWHPWLGIKPFAGSMSPLTGGIRTVGDDLKMFMDIPHQYWDVGVLVDAVYRESPAREFGLLDQDILMYVTVLDRNENVKYPYRYLKSIQELELMVTTADEGDIFVFGVLRNRRLFDVEVVVGQHPGEFTTFTSVGVETSSEYF